MKYYICQIILNGNRLFVLWYENEINGVKTESNQLIYANNIPELLQYSEIKSLLVDINSITQYECLDFSNVEIWLNKPEAHINCEYFLNIWNILIDVISSKKSNSLFLDLAEDEKGIHIYNELFWGANLPGYTPPGKIHIPDWRLEDISKLQTILINGHEELTDIILSGREVR